MNDLLGGVMLIAGLLVTLTAFFMVMELLFPTTIAEIRAVADAQPGRSLLIGAVNLLFFGVAALASLAIADSSGLNFLALPGLVVTLALAIGLLFGLSAVAQLLGARLTPTTSRMRRSIGGGLSLTLACLLPFVGWFVLLPYVGILGLGALIICQVGKRGQSQRADSTETGAHDW